MFEWVVAASLKSSSCRACWSMRHSSKSKIAMVAAVTAHYVKCGSAASGYQGGLAMAWKHLFSNEPRYIRRTPVAICRKRAWPCWSTALPPSTTSASADMYAQRARRRASSPIQFVRKQTVLARRVRRQALASSVRPRWRCLLSDHRRSAAHQRCGCFAAQGFAE